MKRTAEEVANQKNQTIEEREARIRELEAENEQLREERDGYRKAYGTMADILCDVLSEIYTDAAVADSLKWAAGQADVSPPPIADDYEEYKVNRNDPTANPSALDDTDSGNGSDSHIGDPEQLLKVGRSLVDEEEVVVVEINGLAYPGSVLAEIAWRYNKYPGLKRDHERLREAVSTHRSHGRISGTDILRTAAEQVDSTALARDLLSMANDLDNALNDGAENQE